MGGVNKLDSLAARLAGEANPSVIRAYHGSPHDFDRFDASKIGTGEGGQVYGHGLYFAGNEDVARSYRDQLASLSVRSPDGPAVELPTWISRRMIEEDGPAVWRDRLLGVANKTTGDADQMRSYADAMRRLEGGGELVDTGHMYEVELGYPENDLLDYDRPMGSAIASRLTPALRSGLKRDVRKRLEMGQLKQHADNLRQMADDPSLAPGQLLLHGAADSYGAAAAARQLKDAGIPGLRYLDQGSRSEGGGTRNYVVFPGAEDQIRILRKFAVPGAVGTGAASQYEESP